MLNYFYENDGTFIYLHCNGSTTNPDPTLASPDTAELASRKIIDEPGYGERIMIKTITFKTKPRAFSNKRYYARISKRPNSINMEKNMIKEFQTHALIFKMELVIRTMRNFSVPFFFLQND
jgi:hypothetical protein